MREANCFPPAEHNPSSLTPTSSSQPPVALQEPLCLRPQLIPNSLGLFFFFWDVPCLHCTPAAPPLPSTSRTSSSSPCCCLICGVFFFCFGLTNISSACAFSQKIPAIFSLRQGKLLSSHCSSSEGASPPPGCPEVAFPGSLHPSHTPRPWDELPALLEDPEVLPHVWRKLCLGKCDTSLKH